MLPVMFIGTDYKYNTSVPYPIKLDYSFKKWTNIFSSLKSTLRINTCALKHLESSFLKKPVWGKVGWIKKNVLKGLKT